jgi:hypothetical protein
MLFTSQRLTRFLRIAAILVVVSTATQFILLPRATSQELQEREFSHEDRDELDVESKRVEERSLASEMSSRLQINPKESNEFFSEEEAAGRTDEAWAKLVNALQVPTRSDVKTSDFESAQITGETVRAYFRMLRSPLPNDLSVSPESLVWIQEHWTLRERADYAQFLKRAAEIVDRRQTLSLQAAYEKALQDYAKKGYAPAAIPNFPEPLAEPVGPFLAVSADLPSEPRKWMQSTAIKDLEDFYVNQFGQMSQEPINTNRLRIVNLVPDQDTSLALSRPSLAPLVLEPPAAGADGLARLIRENRSAFLVVIGHIDDRTQSLADIPIASVRKMVVTGDTPVLILGCNSAAYLGSGATDLINSVDVVRRLEGAVRMANLGDFLKRLAGPDLHLALTPSMVSSISRTLQATASNKYGQPILEMEFAGFPQLGEIPPASSGMLAGFCLRFKIPYKLAASAVASLTLTFMALSAGAAFPGKIPLGARGLRLVRQLGHVVLVLAIYLSVPISGIAAFCLILVLIPDDTWWVPLVGFPLTCLVCGSCKMAFDWFSENSVRTPRWAELSAGFVGTWLVGTAIGCFVLG